MGEKIGGAVMKFILRILRWLLLYFMGVKCIKEQARLEAQKPKAEKQQAHKNKAEARKARPRMHDPLPVSSYKVTNKGLVDNKNGNVTIAKASARS